MRRSVPHPSLALARLARAALLLLLASLPATAWATHGGPTTLEVLGRDGDNKIYLLRDSESGAGYPPELFFFQLDEAGAQLHHSPRFSGEPGTNGATKAWATFNANLKALKSRLARLKKASKTDWSAATTVRGQEACPEAPWEERLCDVLDVRFTAAGQTTHRRFYAWPGRRAVQSAWRLADGSVLLIYRYMGTTTEGGYTSDDAILVRPTPPPTKDLPWTHGCSKTGCGVKVGSQYVIKTVPGLMKCVAQDGWLGCLYGPLETHLNRGWFVRLADGETTRFGAELELESTADMESPKRGLSTPRWNKKFVVWRNNRYRRPPGR